jgi:type I restriction enzyme R subunit
VGQKITCPSACPETGQAGSLSYSLGKIVTELFRRRHLPHWDVPGATYFVTTCLDGSIPAIGLQAVEEYRRQLESQPRPQAMSEEEWEHRRRKLVFAKLDELLDHEPAIRHCERPEIASIIRDSIYHFADVRYRLLAYVIMPSHLHWVFRPIPKWCATLPTGRTPREVVMHSLKSYTANKCNDVLRQSGGFWLDESYDHWVRDDDELSRIITYVENNPVKAKLVDEAAEFVFSSAYDRQKGILL